MSIKDMALFLFKPHRSILKLFTQYAAMLFKTLVITSLIGSGIAAPGMIFNCADNMQGNYLRPCVQTSLIIA